MLKSKAVIFFMLILFFSNSFSIAIYQPDQVLQYINTHSCESCDLSSNNFQYDISFNGSRSKLHAAILDLATMPSTLDQSDFSSISAIKTRFYLCSASESNFMSANLEMTDFSYANLSGSNFTNSKLNNAIFKSAKMTSCDFTGANFSGADLTDADLHNSKVTKQQLATASNLSNTILPNGVVCIDKSTCLKNYQQ